MSFNVTGFLSEAEDAARGGLNALVSAKFAEAGDRAARKKNKLKDTVTGATVAPVQDVKPPPPAGVAGMTTGQIAIGIAVLIAAVFILRKL
jgi:hypothetical protein